MTLDGHLVGLLEASHHVASLPFRGVQRKDCTLVEGDAVLKELGRSSYVDQPSSVRSATSRDPIRGLP